MFYWKHIFVQLHALHKYLLHWRKFYDSFISINASYDQFINCPIYMSNLLTFKNLICLCLLQLLTRQEMISMKWIASLEMWNEKWSKHHLMIVLIGLLKYTCNSYYFYSQNSYGYFSQNWLKNYIQQNSSYSYIC